MNNYYIYIYLDPIKYGHYCYDNICFLYKPIYVGKGRGYRYLIKHGRNPHFKNILNKIKKLGLESIKMKLYENLNEKESFEKEIELINEIGRIDLKTGFLVNKTIGGEGISGYKFSEETKIKMSEKRKEYYKKHQHSMFGKHHNIHTKNKISEKLIGRKLSEETRIKMRKNQLCQKGEKNNNSVLIIQDVIQIKLLLKNKKLKGKEFANIFEVSPMTISDIKNKKCWSYINLGVE